jgi:hypothetical protein
MAIKMRHFKVQVGSVAKAGARMLSKMDGYSISVKGYTPKQAKFKAFLSWAKGSGLTFRQMQEHRKFWMRHPKIKVLEIRIGKR